MNIEDIFDPLDPQKLWDHLDGIVARDPFRHNCPSADGEEIYSRTFEFIDCQCFPDSRVAKQHQEKLRGELIEFEQWQSGQQS